MRYDPAFGGAIAAAGGALGALIPPSNLMIIYGIVAEQSIPRLFLAGFHTWNFSNHGPYDHYLYNC